MDADGVLVVDPASVDDGPRLIQDEDLGRPLGPEAVGQAVADVLQDREWQAKLLGEPSDRDRPILLVGVDAEEADTSLPEIAGDLGQPRGIGLGEGTLGPEEGQDDDLSVAGLIERVPGSPVVLESETDRRLRRFARPDQADQRHDPDQTRSNHRPALNIPNPLLESRIDNTTSVREIPRIRSGSAATPVEGESLAFSSANCHRPDTSSQSGDLATAPRNPDNSGKLFPAGSKLTPMGDWVRCAAGRVCAAKARVRDLAR